MAAGACQHLISLATELDMSTQQALTSSAPCLKTRTCFHPPAAAGVPAGPRDGPHRVRAGPVRPVPVTD